MGSRARTRGRRRARVAACVLALAAMGVSIPPAAADEVEPLFNANVLAMGGAARAVAMDVSNVELNPAALIVGKRYAVELSGGLVRGSSTGLGRVAISDNLTAPFFKAGVSYDLSWNAAEANDPGWQVVGEDETFTADRTRNMTVALAAPIKGDMLGIGASLKTARFELVDGLLTREWTSDVGLYFRPVEKLALGLVANNLLPFEDSSARPTSVALATAFYPNAQLLLTSDVLLAFAQGQGTWTGFHLGASALLSDVIPLRVGFYTEEEQGARINYATWGLGISGVQTGLSYAMRKRLGEPPSGTPAFYHLLSLQLTCG